MKYEKGSEWRRWDLHVHTKGTMKSDRFESPDFDIFCVTMFKKALENNIAVIGITDYFNMDNYKKIKRFVDGISSNKDFSNQEKSKINKIFILPNVELRMLPVTDQGSLINIHCLFNPDEKFLSRLENAFFGSLEDTARNKMNEDGITSLGHDNKKNLSDEQAYKNGIDNFHVEPSRLRELFKGDKKLEENTIVAVSNSSNDGASGLQGHYLLFENEPGSTDEIRKNIYKMSDAIFSGNEKDRDFFLGKIEGNNEQSIKEKCGSLKPCIHGSDAHEEVRLFNPDKKRYCWIKADPTFEGLKQIIYEPEYRVYIGEKPPMLDVVEKNKTKYIRALKINKSENHKSDDDVWFDNIEMNFNKELVAIIGNKGSGKSGVADILSLLGNTNINPEYFSFLKKGKFYENNLASKFKAELIWESDGTSGEKKLDQLTDHDKPESVRYIPQSYFEQLTNEIEISKFQEILENIIFGYIPEDEKLGQASFKELENYRTENIENEIRTKIRKLQEVNDQIIDLERKKHPDYLKRIDGFIESKELEVTSQRKSLAELPVVLDPNEGSKQKSTDDNKNSDIEKWNAELQKLGETLTDMEVERRNFVLKHESLKKIKERITQMEISFREFVENNRAECEEYGLVIGKILKVAVDHSSIDALIAETNQELLKIAPYLKSIEDISADNTQDNNQSILWKIYTLQEKVNAEINTLSTAQKAFQENEQRKKEIQKTIKQLTGDETHPDTGTLNAYSKEKRFLNKHLSGELQSRREMRLDLSEGIFNKKNEILDFYNSFKTSVDNQIIKSQDLLAEYDIKIEASFKLKYSFFDEFLRYINKGKKGSFYGKEEGKEQLNKILDTYNFNVVDDIRGFLSVIIEHLDSDKRSTENEETRYINEQVTEIEKFYEYLFSLEYLVPKYELKLGEKNLSSLSPGERGALLLIFYLMIDKEEIPLIIDQPEDNLDNESVYNMLSKFIRNAKQKRQIIMVTHNPNLAVGADAEQIIKVSIDKFKKNTFEFYSGAIENPEMNKAIVKILEGTKPAFDQRKLKYQEK